jgi:hypothetical protein
VVLETLNTFNTMIITNSSTHMAWDFHRITETEYGLLQYYATLTRRLVWDLNTKSWYMCVCVCVDGSGMLFWTLQ